MAASVGNRPALGPRSARRCSHPLYQAFCHPCRRSGADTATPASNAKAAPTADSGIAKFTTWFNSSAVSLVKSAPVGTISESSVKAQVRAPALVGLT